MLALTWLNFNQKSFFCKKSKKKVAWKFYKKVIYSSFYAYARQRARQNAKLDHPQYLSFYFHFFPSNLDENSELYVNLNKFCNAQKTVQKSVLKNSRFFENFWRKWNFSKIFKFDYIHQFLSYFNEWECKKHLKFCSFS